MSALPMLDERNRAFELLARNDLEHIRLENERLAGEARMQEARLAEEARMKNDQMRLQEAQLTDEGRLRLMTPNQRAAYLHDALHPMDEYAGVIAMVRDQSTREAWDDMVRVVLAAPANVRAWRPDIRQKRTLAECLRRYARQRLAAPPVDADGQHLLLWMSLITEDNLLDLLRNLTPVAAPPVVALPPPSAAIVAPAVVVAPPAPIVHDVARQFVPVTNPAGRQRNATVVDLGSWPDPAAQWLTQIRCEGVVHTYQYLRLDAVGPLERILPHAEEIQTSCSSSTW